MKTREISKEIISKLTNLGFSVYMNQEGASWLVYEKGGKIGYLQTSDWSARNKAVSISTIHKPSSGSGTGFRVTESGHEIPVEDLTAEDLEEGFAVVPAGFGRYSKIKKWDSIEDYIKNSLFGKEYKKVA